MSNPTLAQLQALLQYASKRLGTTPEQLAKAVQSGGLEALASHLSPADAAKLQNLTRDKARAEQMLQSPAARQVIEQALKDQR